MTDPLSDPIHELDQTHINSTSGRASYRPRHSSPLGKVSWPEPAPGVAGPDQRRGALVREAATEGGSQPEEKQPPRRRQRVAPNSSRKRSPKPPSDKRSHVCSVRLNDDEKTLLSSAAAAAHTTLPAFLARSGMAAAHDLDNTAAAIAGHREMVSELFAARRHLGRVGTNLNQITRAINSGGQPEELDAVLAAVRRAVDRVQAATDHLLNQP
ncbi:MobC family plasmid mobilization relaxosome protein [Streptomyces sp. NPDC002082]|uniref:MobC family plasmid mobilization relaxosome protein n=1 Tax=Streptomyces sp. NPDC002082 TaxID=3154772 RepID=UPI0033224EC8